MRRGRAFLLALAISMAVAAPAWSEAALGDPAAEAHAHRLFREIRCVVCQNESIDDSEAELAGDLRAIVRRQVAQGRSDADIRRYLTDRYGEFVLLKPRLSLANALLWLAPFAIVGAGLTAVAARRPNLQAEPALTAEERGRLAALAPDATVPPQSGPTAGA